MCVHVCVCVDVCTCVCVIDLLQVKAPYDSQAEICVPLLHSLRPFDPTMAENSRHVESLISTQHMYNYYTHFIY